MGTRLGWRGSSVPTPDQILFIAVVLLFLGGLGDNFQPSRLILLIFGVPIAIAYIVGGRALRGTAEWIAVLTCLVILVFGMISLAWTPAFQEGLNMLAVVGLGMLAIALACAAEKSFTAARRVRDAWSYALALTLPFAAYELFTGTHFVYALEDRNLGADIGEAPFASVFFGNFNNYCVFISLALPMMFGTIESSRSRAAVWFWSACAAMSVIVVFVNTNRLSIAFVSWLLVFFAITRPRWRVPAALLIGITGFVLSSGGWREQVDQLLAVAVVKVEALAYGDDSFDQRLGLIEVGIDQVVRSYGMGGGVGSFEDELRSNHPDLIPNAHNLLIEFAANFGLLPTLAFVAFLLFMFLASLRTSLPRDLRSPVLASVPFVPVIGAINSQAIGYTYWWLWFATVFLIAATNRGPAVQTRRPRDKPCGPTPQRKSALKS